MTAELRPIVHSRYMSNAFARVLEGVTALTDHEPTASFVDEEVVAAGEQLFQVFLSRIREANDQHRQDAAPNRAGDPTPRDARRLVARQLCDRSVAPEDGERDGAEPS